MSLSSARSFISALPAKAAGATQYKRGIGILAAAFTSLMLVLPVSIHAQVPDDPGSPQAQIEDTVNINTADAETLALALDGVGMAKARDIIAYREQNGAFETVDDLQKVRGIGKATLERNRSRILVIAAED